VAHVEGGKKNLSFDSLMTIATHLGVPLEKLVSGLEERARADDLALPELKRKTNQGKEPKAPELQRILTQLRGQRASLDRTITRLDEFASPKLQKKQVAKRTRASKSK
jgi:hypothetical protein